MNLIEREARQYFKDNPTAQDNMFATYTISRMQTALDAKLIDLSDELMVHGYLMAAHLRGFGNINTSDIWWDRWSVDKGLWAYYKFNIDSGDASNTKLSHYLRAGVTGWLEKNGDPCSNPLFTP
jgi:hypothetical protein